jgi:hypothetical protein
MAQQRLIPLAVREERMLKQALQLEVEGLAPFRSRD